MLDLLMFAVEVCSSQQIYRKNEEHLIVIEMNLCLVCRSWWYCSYKRC